MTKEKQTVRLLIQSVQSDLKELFSIHPAASDDFICGQIYAYVDCLEILQLCPSFRKLGLNYDVEKSYPLN